MLMVVLEELLMISEIALKLKISLYLKETFAKSLLVALTSKLELSHLARTIANNPLSKSLLV